MIGQQIIYWAALVGFGAGIVLLADTPAVDWLLNAFIRRLNKAGRRV